MPLIRQGKPVEDDFIHVADGMPLPAEGSIVVGLARWQEERGLIEPRNTAVGVRLKPSDPVEQIAGDLDRLSVIALEFPKFNDGRAMSQARLLRDRYGYSGEIRATGKVVRDLLLFMHRCGFDAFEVADNITAEVVRGERTSDETVEFALGFHGVACPVLVSRAARLFLSCPPTLVKEPPA